MTSFAPRQKKKNNAPSVVSTEPNKVNWAVLWLHTSTLSTILNGKDAIIHAPLFGIAPRKKNLKTTTHKKLEEALLMWFKNMQAKNVHSAGEW